MSITIIIRLLLVRLFFLIQPIFEIKEAEKTPFECGFENTNIEVNIFSINYFYMTIVFLIFDLEVVFIAPIAIFNLSASNTLWALWIVMYFTAILVLEWYNSMMEWER